MDNKMRDVIIYLAVGQMMEGSGEDMRKFIEPHVAKQCSLYLDEIGEEQGNVLMRDTARAMYTEVQKRLKANLPIPSTEDADGIDG